MRVENILPAASRRLVVIAEDATLADAAKLLLRPDTDLLVVCDADKRMTGVISKTDVVRQISRRPQDVGKTPVSTFMTRDVLSWRRDHLLNDAWTTMRDRRLKNAPILDHDSHPIGLLNVRDLLEALLGEIEHEEALLRDYVMNVGHPRV
jgi:CBS domain-containing protein